MKRINSVLLVEDDKITNFLNERLIKKLGIVDSINIVNNGFEALEYIHSTIDSVDACPELILLDINMPVMDGFDFVNKFHQLFQEYGQKAIIVILTTSNHSDDLNKLSNAGITDFLSKPLTENKIMSIVDKYFSPVSSYKMA